MQASSTSPQEGPASNALQAPSLHMGPTCAASALVVPFHFQSHPLASAALQEPTQHLGPPHAPAALQAPTLRKDPLHAAHALPAPTHHSRGPAHALSAWLVSMLQHPARPPAKDARLGRFRHSRGQQENAHMASPANKSVCFWKTASKDILKTLFILSHKKLRHPSDL